MKIFRTYNTVPKEARGCVVAIGNFDGVHRGHQALLNTAKSIAADMGVPCAVLTFEPHPRKLFRPDDQPFRITPSVLKCQRLDANAIEYTFELGFDWDFASQSADDFITHVLIEGLQAQHVVVGFDFCFGQLRKGSPETIKEAGIPITVLDKVCDDGDSALSSSRVRQALRLGEIGLANEILGWDWELYGTVVKGDQRGRELGYPTANFALDKDAVHPSYGVYAGYVRIDGESAWLASATNLGIRPMFEVSEAQVEAFIFDFDREIYGKTLHWRPVKKLRGEAKFQSLEDLILQMQKDCTQAREILK